MAPALPVPPTKTATAALTPPRVAALSPVTSVSPSVDTIADEATWASETLALVLRVVGGAAVPRAGHLTLQGAAGPLLCAADVDVALMELLRATPGPATLDTLFAAWMRVQTQCQQVLNKRAPEVSRGNRCIMFGLKRAGVGSA